MGVGLVRSLPGLDFPGGSDGKGLPTMWKTGFNLWIRKISCRRKWQPTPVFLAGKSHGQRSLVGYSPWGHKQSEQTSLYKDYVTIMYPA